MKGNPQKEPMISLRNVSLSYWIKRGSVRRCKYYALQDISFDLYRGDSLGIIGLNGSGKSTLLKLLAGIMEPDSGQIIGVNKYRCSLLSLQLGFVEYLSGRENAILSGMFLGMPKSKIEARMKDIIRFAELGEFIDQPLSAYSSGMRARLGFAVAFQLDPDVLLVDEVLGVGDAKFQEKSFLVMQERISSENNTVVFVSHAEGRVQALCNRALWLDQGRLRMAGGAAEVVSAYEDSLTYQFNPDQDPPLGRDMPFFVRKKNDVTIYALYQDELHVMESWDAFVSMGGRSELVQVVSATQFKRIEERYPYAVRG